jgi:hypothetical protein
MSAQVLSMQPRPSRLADLEQVVERGQRSFVEVGKALRSIRDERLYDAAFGTFEAYCQSRFGMGRNYLNKIIAATETVEILGTTVPIAERVARPLTKLEPDAQRKVWSEATERWLKPTAAQVTEVIGEMFPKPAAPRAPIEDPSGPTCRLVLVLDDLEECAKALSICMELAKVERLHELLGQRLEKRRAVLSPNARLSG